MPEGPGEPTSAPMALAFAVASLQEKKNVPAAEKIALSRARNREHARRTRLRKKAQMQELQAMVRSLEEEKRALKQKVEENNIANILLGLGGSSSTGSTLPDGEVSVPEHENLDSSVLLTCGTGGRRRFPTSGAPSSASFPLTVNIDGRDVTVLGVKGTHVNWKTGVYRDEKGNTRTFTAAQLQSLR